MFYSGEKLLNIENFNDDRKTQEEFVKYRVNELLLRIKTLTKLKIVSLDMPKLCKIIDCLVKAENAVLNATGCLSFKASESEQEDLED